MTFKTQQIELDNALVAPENRHVIGKCNMRINPGMNPKEPTYQVALDALALTTCYLAFLVTTEVPVIYTHQFWATVIKHKSSYQFKIDKKRFSVNVEVLREILNIFPKVSGKEFDEPPTEEEALSFIHELGHSGEIRFHILWGMYYKKNLDFVALIWEDLAYQIDNIDSKKQDKMFYPRFKKIIIHHFLTKDKFISWRNKMFMHTARDDSVLAFSYEESPSKKKFAKVKKVATAKPKTTKKKALVKANIGKVLNVLSEVALSKADQLKEAQNNARKTFTSHMQVAQIPGVPDVPKYDFKSKKESWGDSGEENEDDENDSKDKSDDGKDDDDDDANDDNNQEEKIDDEETIDEEEDDEVTKELYDDVNVNLGNEDTDMINADQGGSSQQNVSQESGFEKIEEDDHVTLTSVLETQKTDEPVLSSSVSSDFTSKLLNLENPSLADNEIASLMVTTTRHATTIPKITSSVLDFATPVIEKNVIKALEAAVLARSSSQPKSTYEAAASLSEFELTKILIDKMKEIKSHLRANYKKKLYDALVESYDTDKDLFNTYEEEPSHTIDDSGVLQDQEFNTGNIDEQSADKEVSKADWFKKPKRPPNLDSDWNKRQQVDSRPPQTWISQVAHAKEPHASFDELMDTSFDFSAFVLNRLNIKDLT
ncbi:hypothetical protein Tco_0162354 [Tanacetum coccineum]